MTIRILKYIIFIFFLSCSTSQDKPKDAPIKTDTIVHKEFIAVDTSKVIIGNNYYRLVRTTDSTSLIKWGNQNFENFSQTPVDNSLLGEKLFLDWHTDTYIVLGMETGSDTWYSIFLPLTTGAKDIFFYNPLTVDKKDGLVVYPHYIDSDTLIIVENLQTRKKQFIGMNWKKCSSAFIHYCIDSINISNKNLFIKWVTPNVIDESNKAEIKKIKITI